ncbi:MAG TPA: serine/threonine-protein kinase [Tepidisphaeraceae bacterium]|jgi:hypothetical protein
MTTTATIASPERREGGAAGYRYQHGDRPLEGYTIQRGAGRGGFGEVYYALSDSGREVALKVVHTYEQIELRGIGQCMNLKSPHLVTIFDVKYGNDGRPWVIMEYVSGPSLRELLDAAPAGLGVQKAAFFLREIGKGLTELHDCGIVHRDLKPANIFFENGYVKIGDYGLSKLISSSQHSGQTVTVGTVHYMAPEIGVGRYDKGIDIYAMGALLYEMLTGQVPYLGSSPAEVLMKHLNGTVDVSGIEEPFATVIRKAMAKDPAERYGSVQEMVEAVFGTEHVRNSVSQFSPDSLSMVAGQAAKKIAPAMDGTFTPSDAPAPPPYPRNRFEERFDRMQRRMKDRCDRVQRRANMRLAKMGVPGVPRAPWLGDDSPVAGDLFQQPSLDPMPLGARIVLGVLVALMASVGAAVVDDRGPAPLFFVFWSIAGATTALSLSWRLLAPGLRHESPWLMRIVLGGAAGIVSVVFTVPFWHAGGRAHYGGTSMAVLLGFLILDWPARLTAIRPARVSFGHIITATIAAYVLTGMFDGNPALGIFAVAGTALAVGLVSGWNPTARRPTPPRPAEPAPTGAAPLVPPPPVPVPTTAVEHAVPAAPFATPEPPLARIHKVPTGVRILWLVLFIAAATLGLTLLACSLFVARGEGQGPVCFAFGCGASILAFICYRRSTVTQFDSWWSYFFRPLVWIGCVQAILLSVSFFVTEHPGLGDGETAMAIFWIIFPAVVLFVITLYRNRGGTMSYASTVMPAPAGQPGRPSITLAGIGGGFLRFVSSVAGLIVLAASLLLTVAVVSNLPGLGNSPAVDPHFSRDMVEHWGTRHWPELIRHIGIVVALVLAFIATGLLLLPRRGAGAVHMFRGLIAVGLAFVAAVSFGRALPDWSEFVPGETPAATIETIFESIRLHGVLVGAGLFVLAAFLFLWPPKARNKVAA